ncbi:bifunctional DNA primase/polymerase [Streptomyces daliensis]|uniref:Bifunctional DNA primase/polymerase n=1 Tax=Streptomyces daliensis TaxID=299421 RepID=A0A8T4ILD9_9ACTN|nr:bifunctional DNA primase/polymerase [Streptomyces daliensis]
MTQPVTTTDTFAARAALAAAERGWHVFPLRPGAKIPAGHREDLCPRTGRCANGHLKPEQRATTDPDLIRQCWNRRPYGIGIATGPSGLAVIDLDVAKENKKDAPDGATTFQALCERAGQSAPATFTVRTPSGGLHLYYAAPVDVRLHNTQRKLGPGIDTRAWGGYVVAPGTAVNGQSYRPLDQDAPVAPLPSWLRDQLVPAPRISPAAPNPARSGSRCADAVLERETAAVAAAQEGGREAELFRAARAMGRFVAWGDISRDVVEEAFQKAGESTGLPASQCRATLRSALNWSIRTCRPRGTA